MQDIKIEKLKQLEEHDRLSRKQKRQFKRLQKKQRQISQRRQKVFKKIAKWVVFFGVASAISYGGYTYYINQELLPPTDMANHIEKSPPSHILKESMDIRVFKHMLEHADGKGKPGVIINYNCKEFKCKNDFITKLEEFAKRNKYKEFIYVAPFKSMSAKLVITKLGKQEILDDFDEDKIKQFIENE